MEPYLFNTNIYSCLFHGRCISVCEHHCSPVTVKDMFTFPFFTTIIQNDSKFRICPYTFRLFKPFYVLTLIETNPLLPYRSTLIEI